MMAQTTKKTLAQAFKQTDYYIYAADAWHRVAVGAPCPDRLRNWLIVHCHGPCAWIITAYNPRAEAVIAETNRQLDAELKFQLDSGGHSYVATDSHARAGDWPAEPGVCVLDMDENQARLLASRFEQAAMLAMPVEGTITLVWLDG